VFNRQERSLLRDQRRWANTSLFAFFHAEFD
jgi:hypothetical protein